MTKITIEIVANANMQIYACYIMKVANLNWLLNKNSKLSLDNKVLLYNAVIKPIWI